jgi:glycosyltransferase involved in cell wall biosynthesis
MTASRNAQTGAPQLGREASAPSSRRRFSSSFGLEHADFRIPAAFGSPNSDCPTELDLGFCAAGFVLLYISPAVLQDPGGGEVQLRKTAEYLRRAGVDARLMDAWHDRIESARCLHLFGTLPEHVAMARVARRRGVPVVLSPISWYDWRMSLRAEPTWWRRLRAAGGLCTRRLWRSCPSWRRELLHLADCLLPNSQAEAEQLVCYFGVPRERIAVVPNGVEERFAHGDASRFETEFGVRDFVLMTGRIEPRKNQLGLIRALRDTSLPLVLVGDPHIDHASYFAECRVAAGPTVRFVPRLDHDSAMLAAAYAAARVVALPSWFETPGLTALEGALAGANVVVTAIGSAKEYFGRHAWYVRPDDPAGIRRAVVGAWQAPRRAELCEHVRRNFLWTAVAQCTGRVYEALAGMPAPACEAQRP